MTPTKAIPIRTVCHDPLGPAKAVIEQALAQARNDDDPGAPFEPEVLGALRRILAQDRAQYLRYRSQFKKAHRGILLPELDQAIRGAAGAKAKAESAADALVAMVQEAAELFHDFARTPYASFVQDGHRETWPLHSGGFRKWLGARYYRKTGKTPRDASIKDAINTLAGIAEHDGPEHKVWLRVAKHEGRYYLDLCNEAWQAVEVTADGWQVLDHPPVRFRRTPTMKALPLPIQGGKIALLWETVNIPEADRPFVLVYLLECWRPETHFLVLEIGGEQGSSKSDSHSRLRDLVDPSEVNLRAAPAKVEDIFVAAANNWLVSFNNLSHLPAPQQDALCTLATGGGSAGRTFYTNAEETVIEVQRPVMLNGIATLATAPDLIDRTLRLELPRLRERRLASELAAQFEQDRPAILGGLLDLFSATLKALPEVRLPDPPRMADFATLGEAMFRALGRVDSFNAMYRERCNRAALAALAASPVACAVLAYLDRHPRGGDKTLKAWFDVLRDFRQDPGAWPRSSRELGDALRRQAPGLRVAGVEMQFGPDGYHVAVRKLVSDTGPQTLPLPQPEDGIPDAQTVPGQAPQAPHGPPFHESSCELYVQWRLWGDFTFTGSFRGG